MPVSRVVLLVVTLLLAAFIVEDKGQSIALALVVGATVAWWRPPTDPHDSLPFRAS